MVATFSSAEVTYNRSYGQHDFASVQGGQISVLSEPNWESFIDRLQTAGQLGCYAVSPELITSPVPLEDIPAMRPTIENRIAEVQEVSAGRPDTTVVLGTATFNNPFGRPANSQVYMRGGQIIGQTNKRHSCNATEKAVFTLRPPVDLPEKPLPGIAGLVCSDLLGESLGESLVGQYSILTAGSDMPNPPSIISSETMTALISTCWAVPIVTDRLVTPLLEQIDPEERYRFPLEGRIAMLFRKYTQLQEVVVADRVPSDSTLTAPLNAYFTRATDTVTA